MSSVSTTSLVSPKRKMRSTSTTSIHSRASRGSTEASTSASSGTLNKSASRRSIISSSGSFNGGEGEQQQRGRLMTLSGFRQRKGTMTGSLKPGSATSSAAAAAAAARKKTSEEGASDGDRSSSSQGLPSVNSASSPSACVVDTDFINNVSGLSSVQAQVMRQITVGDLNQFNTQLNLASFGTYSIDVAVLERKWSNLAMAQNIRGLQKLLNTSPAIVNRSDFIYGFSALHWAAKLDNTPMAELLLYNSADVNSTSSSGSTPLHIAAQLGHERIIDLLVRANASCDARNYAGKQPKDVAAPFLSARCKDLLYANVSKGAALRHGRKLSEHERSILSDSTPEQRGSNPAIIPDRRLGFRERLATSLRITRPSKRLSHPGPNSRRGSSTRKASTGQGEHRGISALLETAFVSPEPTLNAPPSPSLSEPELRRKSSVDSRQQSPSPSPSAVRRVRGVPKDGGRLPLAWVPAVRKRALEVDIQDAAVSPCGPESSSSVPDTMTEESDPLVAKVKLLDSDVQVLVTCT